jgi:hypothetical protein
MTAPLIIKDGLVAQYDDPFSKSVKRPAFFPDIAEQATWLPLAFDGPFLALTGTNRRDSPAVAWVTRPRSASSRQRRCPCSRAGHHSRAALRILPTAAE